MKYEFDLIFDNDFCDTIDIEANSIEEAELKAEIFTLSHNLDFLFENNPDNLVLKYDEKVNEEPVNKEFIHETVDKAKELIKYLEDFIKRVNK